MFTHNLKTQKSKLGYQRAKIMPEKKQLVLYVHKILTINDEIFFRFTSNRASVEPVWILWDKALEKPERIIKTVAIIENALKESSMYKTFRMEFRNDDTINGSNPFYNYHLPFLKSKPYLDSFQKISDQEISFWRNCLIQIQQKAGK